MKDNLLTRSAWIEIDLQALRENFANIRALLPPATQIVAVVKANAYGHGAVRVARCLLAEGASRLAVATLDEALELRAAGIDAPIMLLGACGNAPEVWRLAAAEQIIVPLYSLAMAEQASRAAQAEGRPLPAQLVLDSGMGRIGMQPTAEAVQEALAIARLPGLRLDGMFSHFAAADELDKSHSERQLAVYQQFAAALAAAGLELPLLNIANSAALMEMPAARLGMVRAGIILYGYYPSAEVERGLLRLRPVLSIKARLTHIKWVPAGTPISYGCTFVTDRPSLIGTVPVGYADGWRRALSNRGQVLLAGRRAPIVGRVCMDQFMVDLTEVAAQTGLDAAALAAEEVVLLGEQGGECIDAEEIAARLDTISYEVLSALLPRLPRIYLNSAKNS